MKSNTFGGIWFVDKTLGNGFVKEGYDVKLIGIRKNHPGVELDDALFEIDTINDVDNWEITRKKDVLYSIKKIKFVRTLIKYIYEHIKLNCDYKKCKKNIKNYNPDFIIASHYQLLDAIPKEYLKRTIHVQHSSVEFMITDKKNVRTLKKYQYKIYKLVWLSNTIKDQALNLGFNNSICIYNPVKFSTERRADVVKNKKITVISRIDSEKRIDLMIEIVNDVFKKYGHKDWKFEIYGAGKFNNASKKILEQNDQIVYKGVTYDPLPILLNSSLTLNTSLYEGYPLSIIEGFACGLPVISFNYSDTASEQIIDNYNGFLIKMDDIESYKNKLNLLLTNNDLLEELSINSKEFSKKFELNNILNEWIKLINR